MRGLGVFEILSIVDEPMDDFLLRNSLLDDKGLPIT